MKELPPGLLEEMTRRVVEALDPEAVYLFGSHAWGEPTEDSDVDLLVVVAEPDVRERFSLGVRARQALQSLHVAKDVILRSTAGFGQRGSRPGTFEHQVATNGRLLYPRHSQRTSGSSNRNGIFVVAPPARRGRPALRPRGIPRATSS